MLGYYHKLTEDDFFLQKRRHTVSWDKLVAWSQPLLLELGMEKNKLTNTEYTSHNAKINDCIFRLVGSGL